MSNYDTNSQQGQEDMFTISLNIKQLEDLFHQEEENYVHFLHKKFYQIWNDVSLGETIISQSARIINAQTHDMPSEVAGIVQLIPYVLMQVRYVESAYMKKKLLKKSKEKDI